MWIKNVNLLGLPDEFLFFFNPRLAFGPAHQPLAAPAHIHRSTQHNREER